MAEKKKILVLVGDFVEDYEIMVPFQIMTMLGHEVHVVCPDKKKGDTVATAIHDFESEQTYTEKPGHRFQLTATFAEVNPSDYDGLMIPGGRAPEYLRLNPQVLECVQAFNQANKPIAAICHGPQVLVAAKVLEGKACTAYPALKPDMELAGARWIEPGSGMDDVKVDGNLVTAPAWPGNGVWTAKFLEMLGAPVEIAS
ncbi:ATP-independent intracellular protease PfpI [Planctomycetales bacterium 10988]|nr:ATP-independent intracellular protease PfpI [Planctomycetales bacterium 10988]